MADLDFDELDKAVNTLMAGVDSSKRNTVLDDPEDKVVSLEPTVEETAKGEPATVATTPAPVQESEPVASKVSPSLATKRRGQFMDVMHPSSDMKTVAKPVRRDTVVIAPSNTPEEPAPKVDEPVALELESSLLPAPETISGPVSEPLSSPFLPDAKPEKRPLGGVVDSNAPAEVSASEEKEALAPAIDPEAEKQTPAPEPVVLPAELGSDVLAVESNDLTGATADNVPEDTIEPSELSAEDVSSSEEAPSVPEPSVVPAGGSIPQQYTEAPSTGDQTSGSIYDTANYHQAISAEATPSKKPSPIKWILLALLLLVVGGGVGVGYFFLTR